ncbi:hypothetical protein ACHAWX_005829 [Stephanocyclus meneghinianus]
MITKYITDFRAPSPTATVVASAYIAATHKQRLATLQSSQPQPHPHRTPHLGAPLTTHAKPLLLPDLGPLPRAGPGSCVNHHLPPSRQV